MKILVFSDSHRAWSDLSDIIKVNKDSDVIIFLGDGEDDFEKALRNNGIFPHGNILKDVYVVNGNCDLFSDSASTVTAEIGGVRFLITHGYMQKVKMGLERLAAEAYTKKCQVALFGHTHERKLTNINGVTLFNPGALRNGSYGVIKTDNSEMKFEWRNVRDDIVY